MHMQLFMKEGNNTHFVDCHKKSCKNCLTFIFTRAKCWCGNFLFYVKKFSPKNRGKEIKNQVRSLDSQNEIIAFIAHHRKKLHNRSDAKDLTWFFISFPLFFWGHFFYVKDKFATSTFCSCKNESQTVFATFLWQSTKCLLPYQSLYSNQSLQIFPMATNLFLIFYDW